MLDDSRAEKRVETVGGGPPLTPPSEGGGDMVAQGGESIVAQGGDGGGRVLCLCENVITAELLEQRADGAKRIVIGAKSILTPSARDFLNSRDLDCKRQEADGTSTAARTDWKAIVVQTTPAVVAALDDAGRSTTDHWERELAGTVAEAVAFGVSVVSRAEAVGVVIFSNQAEAAACRANRNRQVRAAVVGDAQSVRRVKSQLGANLFCIAPAGKSYFELRNLLREIGGPPQVPSDWDE